MKTTIVLVQGAFADGGSWGDVIPLLEKPRLLRSSLKPRTRCCHARRPRCAQI
jgi:hypothetical protein